MLGQVTMNNDRIQVIERAIDIIDFLASGPRTLTEVVQRTALPKGTVFRILQNLSYRGLVIKDPVDNRYLLGPGLWRFGQNAVDEVGMMSALAGPILGQLREFTEETITLNIRMGLDRVCIVEHQSPLPLLYKTGIGSRIRLQVGASGKTLLAFTPEPQREKLVRALCTGETPAADGTALRRALDEIHKCGWAVSAGERLAGAAGIAVPVQVPEHQVMALSVLGPESRMTESVRLGLVAPMQDVAGLVAQRLSSI